jgi:hypothetical protein
MINTARELFYQNKDIYTIFFLSPSFLGILDFINFFRFFIKSKLCDVKQYFSASFKNFKAFTKLPLISESKAL